jgi:serine/threonine protein kinase
MSEWSAAGDDSLERMDRLCDAFEDAWQAGQRPRVGDFLAGVEGTLRATLLRELLRLLAHYLRQDQRRRWQQGERVRLRQYLDEAPQLHEEPELVFGLICDEVLLREELSDTPPRPEDYLDLLPSHEVQLRHFFADRRARHQATHNVSSGKATLQRPTVAVTLTGVGQSSEPAAPPLDRYQPGGFIGRGGMGDVFWVHDPHLGRDLALKVLREDRCQPHLVRRFLEEARLHSQLQHPSVAPVHELGEARDGRPFFTMKLVRGRTLAELLKERRNLIEALPRLLEVFGHVCQAVAYAHSRGVIHRDLKPSNIMVGTFGEVQVMDWGLAKMLRANHRAREAVAAAGSVVETERMQQPDEVTQAGTVLGTCAYMPPEQARGEVDRVDERCDVFSLGAILCEFLTGDPPYRRPGKGKIYQQAARGDLDDAFGRLRRSVEDKSLVELAIECLCPSPEGRPKDASPVAEAVAAWLAGQLQKRRQVELNLAEDRGRGEAKRQRRWASLWLNLAIGMLAVALFCILAGQRAWQESTWKEALQFKMEANRRFATMGDAFKRQERYVAAAHLYQEAFTSQPVDYSLLDNPNYHDAVYDAAVAAWLASAGEGQDAASLSDQARDRWRSQALEWLWLYLARYRRNLDIREAIRRAFAEQGTSRLPVFEEDRALAQRVYDRLQHWQQDPGLRSLRDEAALARQARLPAERRKDCDLLWAEVETLMKRAKRVIQAE